MDFSRPKVMGIINVTPDSFYSQSRTFSQDAIARRLDGMLAEGADIIDIGGYSTRSGADPVSPEEEYSRLALALETVRKRHPETVVSVDTFRAEVARRCVEDWQADIINDIGGGTLDPEMWPTVADLKVPYILMHMRGTPQTMQSMTDYRGGIVDAVTDYFRARTADLLSAGIRRENILLDPGFGFAKTLEQNYELLSGLHRLCETGYPVLAGVSRKSMIWRALDAKPADALAGTVALEWECLRQGAAILRAHDVRAAADTIRLFGIYKGVGK